MNFFRLTKMVFFLLNLFLLPLCSRANENDYKIDELHSFPVIEKKAVLNNYSGEFAQQPTGLSHLAFPEQKIFIDFKFENGGILVRDGTPLPIKYPIQFDHLLFSPDHKIALAYGAPSFTPDSKKFCFIGDQGNLINDGNLLINMAKASNRSFVGVCQAISLHEKSQLKSGGQYAYVSGLYLCEWDFSGREVWRTTLPIGEFSEIVPSKLSVSTNGNLIIVGLNHSTRVFDGNGKELDRFDGSYSSFMDDGDETAVFASRKQIRILNFINQTILFQKDLSKNSNSMFHMAETQGAYFGPDENQHADKVLVTEGPAYGLNKIIIFDLKRNETTFLNLNSENLGAFSVYYSTSENKVIFVDRSHIGKNVYKSIDSEN